ncbi:MAG: hypothetical protein PHQ53_00780 [Candidatus Krumholzibacteria bacterium]|nr:hypothetical protein [Candidatus Krumholzibacteria bacterium]
MNDHKAPDNPPAPGRSAARSAILYFALPIAVTVLFAYLEHRH